MKAMRFLLVLVFGAVVALAAGTAQAQTVQINGAGATFPYPIYSKWFAEYNKMHPDVEINYQSIGSGGGIRQLTEQTVFFGATDGPMTAEQQFGGARARSCTSRPSSARVVPIYNIPGVDTPSCKFTGQRARRHHPRQGHQVERRGDRRRSTRA